MKAVILTGGKGTRLAPYTTVFPKPLIPIGHRPILDIIVRQLVSYGIQDITLAVGYLSELIRAYFQNGISDITNLNLSYHVEKEPLGTVGSLSTICGLTETFLAMNGDILTTMDYTKMIKYHHEKQGILTIGMHNKRNKIDLGVMETDINGFLTSYKEKRRKSMP